MQNNTVLSDQPCICKSSQVTDACEPLTLYYHVIHVALPSDLRDTQELFPSPKQQFWLSQISMIMPLCQPVDNPYSCCRETSVGRLHKLCQHQRLLSNSSSMHCKSSRRLVRAHHAPALTSGAWTRLLLRSGVVTKREGKKKPSGQKQMACRQVTTCVCADLSLP